VKNKLYSEVAVPIEPPFGFMPGKKSEPDFTFDKEDCFKDYLLEKDGITYDLSLDDQGQWYFFTSLVCQSLDQLKLSRQIYRPPYLQKEKLELVDLLENVNVEPIYEGHDKAYGHVLSLVPQLDSFTAFHQARLANYDGTDDPTISKKIHFIENEYKGEKTRFISGFETRSFATITENEFYAKEIHLPGNARTYLKLFIYFTRYGSMPSQQMMPRFLANLWASTQSLNTNANQALFKTALLEDARTS
jgi:hypothetical protein